MIIRATERNACRIVQSLVKNKCSFYSDPDGQFTRITVPHKLDIEGIRRRLISPPIEFEELSHG